MSATSCLHSSLTELQARPHLSPWGRRWWRRLTRGSLLSSSTREGCRGEVRERWHFRGAEGEGGDTWEQHF